MPWFVYLNDCLIPAEVRAFTIDDAISTVCALPGMCLTVSIGTASMWGLMMPSSSFGEVMRVLLS